VHHHSFTKPGLNTKSRPWAHLHSPVCETFQDLNGEETREKRDRESMASGWGINGNKGRCYDFWMDFSECMSRCREPKDCALLREDYLECLHHSKEVTSPFLSLSYCFQFILHFDLSDSSWFDFASIWFDWSSIFHFKNPSIAYSCPFVTWGKGFSKNIIDYLDSDSLKLFGWIPFVYLFAWRVLLWSGREVVRLK